MHAFHIHNTVGELVVSRPSLSRVFEKSGIDYCCGGKKTLEQVCQEKNLDMQFLLNELETSETPASDFVDAAAMPLTDLADHIEQTHHAFLRINLPRLDAMTRKVAAVHGDSEPRLHGVRETFAFMAEELVMHMRKEEEILFPMIRQLEASETAPAFHCGSLGNPINQMELEHDQAGSGLAKLSELTDAYQPPNWACNTYRAMLDGLAELERNMHQHVHKENNVLFPRALAMESEKAR